MKKALCILALLSYVGSANATLQTEPDRAKVKNIYATLLLPDGEYLNVDISFDCSSKFKDTGVIITSEDGAKFVANAYSSLYGPEFGEAVKRAWLSKANPSDPRKPTMLLLNSFGKIEWPSNREVNVGSKKVNFEFENRVHSQLSNRVEQVNNQDSPPLPPVILQVCGTRGHDSF
ncbi:hypothetical protein J8M21_20750 [Pseudoalteromonas luteoviolacea]|uniref:hypothetical protein n=1 Tax=Pseudoalteromonas luteoviolacea TaxID=43657 RepID=UPI001B3A6742|nr:hypothetical protein [Pseudoalteromonas luteoviolacea]MBQ4879651.1 hypothetical protein [Pseudoalteromonas luteoviolacea]MBQ4908675.1 hypothetical protein [Pseudoalteromonas luteoviolacea]